MKSFGFIVSALSMLIVFINNSNCNNDGYEKLCYVRYLLKNNLLDENFKDFNSNDPLDEKCMAAVNLTLNALRTSSKEPCVTEFLSRKDIPDALLKKYLMPQLINGENRVFFDDRFKDFRKRTVNMSVVACNHRDIFKPDVAALMKFVRDNKESKEMELKCLSYYVKKTPKTVLSKECSEAVLKMKKEFKERAEKDIRGAFKPPNDNLFDFDCGKKKMEEDKMFEKFAFFVVLATSRHMTDKQIESVAKNTEASVNSAQKAMYECMRWE